MCFSPFLLLIWGKTLPTFFFVVHIVVLWILSVWLLGLLYIKVRQLKILMLSEFPNTIISALLGLGITDSKMNIFLMGLKYVQLIKMKGE